jgi:uncharacterized membrane protein YqjE
MTNDLQTAEEPSLSTLVTGILKDVQDLVKQQLALFRSEVESDFRKTKEAALPLVGGLVVLMAGSVLLSLTLAHLLYWAAEWPLWGCYGLVGACFAALGAVLTYVGKKKFDSFNAFPDETAQALKENMQCLMNPK